MKEENIKSYYWKVWNKLVRYSRKKETQYYPELSCCWLEGMLQWQYFMTGHLMIAKLCNNCGKKCNQCDFSQICFNQIVFPGNGNLSFSIYVYCQEIRISVIQYRIDRGRNNNTKSDKELEDNGIVNEKKIELVKKGKEDEYDYPPIAVACRKKGDKDIQFGHSKSNIKRLKTKNPESFCEKLVVKLKKLSTKLSNNSDFWVNSTDFCKNRPGNCAEPHAVDKVLKATNCNLSDLEFSVPVRPRTMQIRAYCGNCQEVFPFCKKNNPKLCSSECKSDFSKKNNCKC